MIAYIWFCISWIKGHFFHCSALEEKGYEEADFIVDLAKAGGNSFLFVEIGWIQVGMGFGKHATVSQYGSCQHRVFTCLEKIDGCDKTVYISVRNALSVFELKGVRFFKICFCHPIKVFFFVAD